MKIYLATNETPPQWMLEPNNDTVNSPEESHRKIEQMDALNIVPFAWIDEKKKFAPLKAYKKGHKPKIQDFQIIIRWEV